MLPWFLLRGIRITWPLRHSLYYVVISVIACTPNSLLYTDTSYSLGFCTTFNWSDRGKLIYGESMSLKSHSMRCGSMILIHEYTLYGQKLSLRTYCHILIKIHLIISVLLPLGVYSTQSFLPSISVSLVSLSSSYFISRPYPFERFVVLYIFVRIASFLMNDLLEFLQWYFSSQVAHNRFKCG